MVTPRICVVHNSERIRETIAILLEGHGQIATFSVAAVLRDASLCRGADLVIAEADAPTAAIQSIPSQARVLWILDSSRTTPPVAGALSTTLPSSFSPSEVIRKVDGLLSAALPADLAAFSQKDSPFIPVTALPLIHRAQTTDLPVLICGEPGCGKSRVARAIHSANPQRWFRVLAPGTSANTILDEIATARPVGTTLCIRDMLSLSSADTVVLCDLLDRGGFSSPSGWHPIRVISCAPVSYEELGMRTEVPQDLFYRLGMLTIGLEPLRNRTEEIPALAQAIADRLASALKRAPVTFSSAAMTRLQRYLWFGNLLELETVLARSIALTDDSSLGIDHLLFGYGPAKQPQPTPPSQPRATESEASRAADLIINELAHEFKNPLVAIKTVTQQLDHFTRDEAGRQQVAKLAGDAVDRMDQTIENLLQYSHFGAPSRADVPLSSILKGAVDAVRSVAGERNIELDCSAAAPQLVHVDPAQIEYALENLLRAVLRDVDEGRTIAVRSSANDGTIAIEFQKGGLKLSERLSTMLGQPANGHAAAEPLGFVFAKSLVERNEGQIDVSSSGTARVVTVHLPLERNDPIR